MKKINALLMLIFIAVLDNAQNVGIGATSPVSKLHVSGTSTALTIENTAALGDGAGSSIYFAHDLAGGSTYKYAGAIKSIGTSGSSARVGLFTFASSAPGGLLERLSVTDDGLVGIGTISPTSTLDVNGNLRARGVADFNSTVYLEGTTNAGNVISSGYIHVSQDVTVNGGLGIVASSNSARMKILSYTATLSVTNLQPDALLGATGTLTIPAGTFSGTPTAYLGNVTGENGEYYRATLILENVTTTNVTIRIFNGSAQPISFSNAAWKVLIIGPY